MGVKRKSQQDCQTAVLWRLQKDFQREILFIIREQEEVLRIPRTRWILEILVISANLAILKEWVRECPAARMEKCRICQEVIYLRLLQENEAAHQGNKQKSEVEI